MNLQIGFSIILIFLVTFILLIIFEDTIGLEFKLLNRDDELIAAENFFSLDFSKAKTIFLIGSSQVGAINATVVNHLILSETSEEIEIYNLARRGNYPVIEQEYVEKYLSANPEIIFYGISYRDFKFPYEGKNNDVLLPDLGGEISSILMNEFGNLIPSNPQILTRYVFRTLLDNENDFNAWDKSYYSQPNTPFFKYLKEPILLTNSELRNESVAPPNWNKSSDQFRNFAALKDFIYKMQENNVKVVIFSIPLSDYYLESLSNYQIKSFQNTLNDLSEIYDVEIYDFTDKYRNFEIWHNPSHISYHDKITIYNDDIANMILREVNP